jgi:hypothetical protein
MVAYDQFLYIHDLKKETSMNVKKNIFLLLLAVNTSLVVQAKRVMDAGAYHKNFINQQCWFKIIPLQKILEKYPSISYQKCLENISYDFPQFPPSSLFPHKGVCDDSFILKIPNGKVYGHRADVFIENNYIEEMCYKGYFGMLFDIPKLTDDKGTKIAGRVAVITQSVTQYYFHWFQDVLARLALLEMYGVEYDYLYVHYDKPYIKETLELWGIDSSKIITPGTYNFIQADEIILPSYTMNKNAGLFKYAGFHYNPITMNYVAQKLIKAAESKNIDSSKFSRRVFISRKTAPYRKILNEDEIFHLFEAKGFVRYELSDLKVAEQITMFQNAEVIVGEHGAGMTNCLFCKPGTRVIEIFQALVDSGPWWITQVMNLNYSCILTVPVDANYFAHFGMKAEMYHNAWLAQRTVSLENIKKVIETL